MAKYLILFYILYIGNIFGHNLAQAQLCSSYFILRNQTYTEVDFTEIEDIQILMNISTKIEVPTRTESELPNEKFYGLGTLWAGSGRYQGKKVFIKVPRLPNAFDALSIARELQPWGITPKIIGITTIEGRHAFVYEFIDGVHAVEGHAFSIHVSLNMNTYNQALRIRKALIDTKYIKGDDLQYRITPEGDIYLIEYDRLKKPKTEKEYADLISQQRSPKAYKSNFRPALIDMNLFIQQLEAEIRSRGQWHE